MIICVVDDRNYNIVDGLIARCRSDAERNSFRFVNGGVEFHLNGRGKSFAYADFVAVQERLNNCSVDSEQSFNGANAILQSMKNPT